VSYSRLRGGELTTIEIASLTGNLAMDTKGTINTPLAIAAVSETLFGKGSDLVTFLSDIIPDDFLGDGRFAYGPVKATSLPVSLDGSQWNPDLFNMDNLSKKDFAKTGFGLVMSLLVMQLIRQFGLAKIGTAAVAGGSAVAQAQSRAAHRATVLRAIEDDTGSPTTIESSNSARVEVALQHFMRGMARNSRSDITKGIDVLQGTK
jgi:hypothetical protein